MKYFFLSLIAATALVIGVFGLRGHKFDQTPIELFPDMDRMDFVQGQQPSKFFADGLGSRLPVGGTVVHSNGDDDGIFPIEFGEGRTGYYYTGGIGDFYATGMPEELGLTTENMPAFLRRGKERYEIFCTVCHGESGDGKGVASYYGFAGIANLHTKPRETYPDGRMFGVITNGQGLMGGYGANIPVRDRWAIVAYVRALQASQKVAGTPAPAPTEPQPEPAPSTGSEPAAGGAN